MLELGLHDPDLVAMFQWKVLQNIDNIAHYITRLVKVSQWPCFSRKVLRKMDAEHGNLTISHVFSRLIMLWLVSMESLAKH